MRRSGLGHARPPLRPQRRPDTAHPSKLHYPRSIITAPSSKHRMLFISQTTVNTLTTSPVLTFLFWPPFSKQFRLLFPRDSVRPPPSPRVGGRLMKGCSRRNTGETYRGVSQPSHREAGYKKFRAAAAVATGELPSVINPPQAWADAPVCLFPAALHLQTLSLINISPLTSALASPPIQTHFIRALFSFLQPCFHFLFLFSPSLPCFFFFLVRQSEI